MFKSKEAVLKKLEKLNGRGYPSDFRKRLGIYKFSGGKLDFDPVTGLGHSYSWYEITKVIKGKLVLNTYRYSVTTGSHVSILQALLEDLGIKFIEIEAPAGLQRLDRAVERHVDLYAKAVVAEKYARIKSPKLVKQAKAALELAKKLAGRGVKVNVKAAIIEAEQDRERRLEANRNRPRIVSATDADRGKPGMHVDMPSHYIGMWNKRRLLDEAQSKGFKRVYIHVVNQDQAA